MFVWSCWCKMIKLDMIWVWTGITMSKVSQKLSLVHLYLNWKNHFRWVYFKIAEEQMISKFKVVINFSTAIYEILLKNNTLTSEHNLFSHVPGGHSTSFWWVCVPHRFPKVGSREWIFLEKWGVLGMKMCILRAEILAKTRLKTQNFCKKGKWGHRSGALMVNW